MMLGHYTFDNPMNISGDCINYLVVENQHQLSEYIEEIMSQIDGEQGRFMLSDKGQEISIKDNIRLVMDPFNADSNERKNLTGLYSQLSNIAHDEGHYEKSMELFSRVHLYVQELIVASGASATCMKEFDLVDNFKSMGLRFEFGSVSLLDRICDYITTCRDYGKVSLFIFVNLRSFISLSDISELKKFIEYNKIPLLLLEVSAFDYKVGDNIKLIDQDLCEINFSE